MLSHNLYDSQGFLFGNYTIRDSIVRNTYQWMKQKEMRNRDTEKTILAIQKETKKFYDDTIKKDRTSVQNDMDLKKEIMASIRNDIKNTIEHAFKEFQEQFINTPGLSK